VTEKRLLIPLDFHAGIMERSVLEQSRRIGVWEARRARKCVEDQQGISDSQGEPAAGFFDLRSRGIAAAVEQN